MNLEFNKNDDAMRLAVSQMKQRHAVISMGGGKKSMEKNREKGKLAPRERIQYLIDKGSVFTEIGAFAGYDMYKEYGGCPAGGTVAGLGYVHGRQCVIVANDNTVKAGAWFPITGKKLACPRSQQRQKNPDPLRVLLYGFFFDHLFIVLR